MTPAMRYRQGRHFLVVGPVSGCLVPDQRLAQRAWPLVRNGSSMIEILGELLSDGLESLPDLVVYEFDAAGMRVILRGDMTATVETADGSAETSTGHARRTWLEQVFVSAVSGTVGDMNVSDVDLPLHIGMTMAGGFTFSADESNLGSSVSRATSQAADNARIVRHRRTRPDRAGGQKSLSLVQHPSDNPGTRRSQ